MLIRMDANARNSLWDRMCVSVSHSRKSLSMCSRLEEIIDKYGLHILNTGIPTYRYGVISTAPDVTISAGNGQYGNVFWTVIDDELRTPHEGLLINIGDRVNIDRREVINWKIYDWSAYCKETKVKLNSLRETWQRHQDCSIDQMVKELTETIQGCVDLIAMKKIITEHSKPWISPQLDKLKKLCLLKKKCQLQKSPANMAELIKVQKETYDLVKREEDEWWQSQCEKLVEVKD